MSGKPVAKMANVQGSGTEPLSVLSPVACPPLAVRVIDSCKVSENGFVIPADVELLKLNAADEVGPKLNIGEPLSNAVAVDDELVLVPPPNRLKLAFVAAPHENPV